MTGEDVLAYYAEDREDERLLAAPLEFERMKRLLSRFLEPRSRVADVGGGTGRYATWLAELGHDVELVDPVPLHVERARERDVSARLGDARSLPYGDASFDAVLLLGPLYHLGARSDRLSALREAARICRRGGFVAAAAISRFAPLLDLIMRGAIYDDAKFANVRDESRDGDRVPPERRVSSFPEAHFHLPEELCDELVAAGLVVRAVYGVQGPAWLGGSREAWADEAKRARLLEVAELVEEDEHLLTVSPHLLAVGVVP